MPPAFSREAIDQKYRALAARFGLRLDTVYTPRLPRRDELAGEGDGYVVRMDADRIPEEDYEDFLAFHVRRLLLPRLELETDRLLLRPFRREDAEACFDFLSDPVCADMDDGTVFTAMDREFDQVMESYAAQTRCMLVLKETGRVIGTIHLTDVEDRAVETMEIGYTVAPAFQRQGYAWEALSVLLRFVLEELHLDMVVAGAAAWNEPSRRLLEKLGFRCEGTRHKALYHAQRGPIDLMYYYLERE